MRRKKIGGPTIAPLSLSLYFQSLFIEVQRITKKIAGPKIAPLNTLDSLGMGSILKVHIVFLSFPSYLGSIFKVHNVFLSFLPFLSWVDFESSEYFLVSLSSPYLEFQQRREITWNRREGVRSNTTGTVTENEND